MENYHYWLMAGFVLVITELVTGTFYLLVIGIAAFVAAAKLGKSWQPIARASSGWRGPRF